MDSAFFSNIRIFFRNVRIGLKNLVKWLPVIWKDRDWDHYFIYEILKAKLESQAEYIGGRGTHVGSDRDAARMRLAARLIRLQQEEHYACEYLDYCYDWKGTEKDNFDAYFEKYPRQHGRVMSGKVSRYKKSIGQMMADKRLVAMEIAQENQERCRRLIFRIMESHIEGWWD